MSVSTDLFALKETVRESFRMVDSASYPELSNHSWDGIYGNGDKMAPGALYLAANMTRTMDLQPGMSVMDLGCGKGVTSEYLARRFNVRVNAVDLWIDEEFLSSKFASHGLGTQITAHNLDITKPLPFVENQFDSIFCMQAFHSFGGSVVFLRHLLKHLKAGGQICIAGTCFNEEYPALQHSSIFSQTDGWDAEYASYHSPGWWCDLFGQSGLVRDVQSLELDNGLAMWEDVILYGWHRSGGSDYWFERSRWLIEHIAYSRTHRPYLTHFILTAVKC